MVTSPGSPAHAPRFRAWLLLFAVLGAVLLVHWPALTGELVYDDLLMIGQNPDLGDPSRIPALFTRGYWDFLGPADQGRIGYWRPLTASVLSLGQLLSDNPSDTTALHALSLLIHLAAVGMAFVLVRLLTYSATTAALVALLFGLHPVQTEGVAWITALNDPLFAALALAALWRFEAWRRRGSSGFPVVPALLFALALLAKELAVCLLPIALALDWARPFPNREDPADTPRIPSPTRAYTPFLAVLSVYALARMAVFGSLFAGLERQTTDFGVSAARLLWLRVEILGGSLGLLALPSGLSLFHPFDPSLGPSDPRLLSAILLSASLLAGLWFLRARRGPLLFGLLLIPAALLPVLLRVESLGRFPLSERFLYLPALGFALVLAVTVRRWLPGRSGIALLLLTAGGFALGTRARIPDWHDEEALFRSSLETNARSPYVHWGLGRVLLERARASGDGAALAEAFEVFHAAQDLLIEARDPASDIYATSRDYLQVNLGVGWCLVLEGTAAGGGDTSAAVTVFEETLRGIEGARQRADDARERGLRVAPLRLEIEQVHTALGVAHMLAPRGGHVPEAAAAFAAALIENPAYPEAHHNLGQLHLRSSAYEEAAASFSAALALRPGDRGDRIGLIRADLGLASSGRVALDTEAVQRARDAAVALHAQSADSEVAALAGKAEGTLGNRAEALTWFMLATEADPQNGDAWADRAKTHVALGELPAAIAAFRQAVELRPDDFEVHYNLGAMLSDLGAREESRAVLSHALTLELPPGMDPDTFKTLKARVSDALESGG